MNNSSLMNYPSKKDILSKIHLDINLVFRRIMDVLNPTSNKASDVL